MGMIPAQRDTLYRDVKVFGWSNSWSSNSQSSASIQPWIKVGQSFRVSALDLSCAVLSRDRFGQEAGPVLYCDRNSRETGTARGAGISKTHFFITNPDSSRVQGRQTRPS
jgi:hypothetical protein